MKKRHSTSPDSDGGKHGEGHRHRPSITFSHSTASHDGESGRKPFRLNKRRTSQASETWLKRTLPCCADPEVSDSSDDINSRIYTADKGSALDEELIIARLQHAVDELGHPLTAYEIETENMKWYSMLEIEQNLYEESAKPPFRYKFFRKNRYLQAKKLPLYATNYENHRKLYKRVRKFKYGATTNAQYRFAQLQDFLRRFGHRVFLRLKRIGKVNPEPFIYQRPISHTIAAGKRPVYESRFVAKVNAPSQTNSYPFRSEIYQVTEQNMNYIYEAQSVVHKQFLRLLNFKRAQTKWLHCVLAVLFSYKLKTLPALGTIIMLHFKHNNNRVDLRFLRKALEQIVNLAFYCAERKLQRMPLNELLPFLADEVIMLTNFHTEEYHYHYDDLVYQTSSSSSDEEDENGNYEDDSETEEDSSEGSSSNSDDSSSEESESDDSDESYFDYEGMHRKVFGRVDKSPQELRTLLTIRLKRGLNLPYEGERSVLKFLRMERAQKERKQLCYIKNDSMPIDHFIPATISKAHDKVCYTIFHAVVVDAETHFVLKRLPVPKPKIIRVTKAYLASQPGNSMVDRFANLVKTRMLRNVKEIVMKRNFAKWPKHKIRRHLWKVSDHIDDDVYDFLDRILTCVIIVVDARTESVSDTSLKTWKPNRSRKPMYLTPPARRKLSSGRIVNYLKTTHTNELQITTFSQWSSNREYMKKWLKLLEAPPDIVHHHFDSDSDEGGASDENHVLDIKSSSGSSSSLSSVGELEADDSSGTSLESSGTRGGPTPANNFKRSFYLTEKLDHRDRKSMALKDTKAMKAMKDRKPVKDMKAEEEANELLATLSTSEEDDQKIHIEPGKIRHVSAKRWGRMRKKLPTHDVETKYTEQEIKLQEVIEAEATRRAKITLLPTRSKSEDTIRQWETREIDRTMSVTSLRQLIENEPQFINIQGENWRNRARKPLTPTTRSREGSQRSLKENYDPLNNDNPSITYVGVGNVLIVETAHVMNFFRKRAVHNKDLDRWLVEENEEDSKASIKKKRKPLLRKLYI